MAIIDVLPFERGERNRRKSSNLLALKETRVQTPAT
jgi:hypothetical protein